MYFNAIKVIIMFLVVSGSSLSGIAARRFLVPLLVRTRAARKCSGTIPQCGNTYTPTALVSTSVPNVAKLSWRALNSNGTNWFIPAKNRSSVLSRVVENDFPSTSIYARTSGSIPVTGLMYALSTDATKNLHSPQTSSPTSSHTLSKSKNPLSYVLSDFNSCFEKCLIGSISFSGLEVAAPAVAEVAIV